jgi:hypothetical protein
MLRELSAHTQYRSVISNSKLRLWSEERGYVYNQLIVIVMKLERYKEAFNCLSEVRGHNKLQDLTI